MAAIYVNIFWCRYYFTYYPLVGALTQPASRQRNKGKDLA